jgi:hypothetical protein
MSKIASQVPKRNPSGYTPQPPYGPWADCGAGDDFFYQTDADDFNCLPTAAWTATENNGGTIALTAGGGGLLLFTTGVVATNYASIQRAVANLVIPQGTNAGKKFFFGARLMLASLNSGFIAGVVNSTTTPFTAGQITDGIWFSKVAGAIGSNPLSINVSASSTNLATALSFVPTAATEFDVAFYVDQYGNVQYSIGVQLFGWIPQSGTSAVSTSGVPTLPVLCPTGKLYSGNQPTTVASGYTLPSANLSNTVGVITSTGAAQTLTLDFVGAKQER